MADARALLRQQRAVRRIEHPYAAYSESGKLSCSLCNELVRSDALWAGHLRSDGHVKRLERLREASEGPKAEATVPAPKRKLSNTEDTEQSASEDEASQAKRLKGGAESVNSSAERSTSGAATPSRLAPPLPRRTSGTPVHGVEISIPSRPATPLNGSFSASPMPRAGLNERTVSDDANGHKPALSSTAEEIPQSKAQTPTTQQTVAAVDETEWAAFEAEMLGAPPAAPNNAVSDAVIIAAPMSAEQVAAKSEEEERAKRKAMADLQLEDEKEDATRALETEFDEMEDLEARAKRLRERREALRGRTTRETADTELVQETGITAVRQEDQTDEKDEVNEDDDSDTDEDEWDAFRLRR